MSTPLYEQGNVELYKANMLRFRFLVVLRQGSFLRKIYIGNIRIPAYVDTHRDADRKAWYGVHAFALKDAMDHGDFAHPLVLEWKILQSEKTVSRGLNAYTDVLRAPATAVQK